ncbi:MAG: phenylacetate-CoA oxygenase subunit PaaJ [Osedax symbiont Rs2]|nr:MAG: phenylacetate-CoA oxygenase subunit PaaJ [Osedax symbiont Rs2]
MQQISLVTPEFAARRALRANSQCPHLWSVLDNVFDPELPHVTIWDLGILVDVHSLDSSRCKVVVSPTYSGCPAIDVISEDIVSALNSAGVQQVEVAVSLKPAWNTDLISPAGKAAMLKQGIAPPDKSVNCPLCGSGHTSVISQFGSTACKALYRCNDCLEPFDHFKEF